MINNPFPPELRTLAFIPRWCIVMTTIKDYVASHSYFVTVYSYVIAEMIGWMGPRDYLMLNALMHDNDESITGDITGPVKNHIVRDEYQEILDDITKDRMGGLIEHMWSREAELPWTAIKEADAIVATADKLDAYLFLVINQRMGNTVVKPALEYGIKSVEAAWKKMPAAKEVLDRTWNTEALPSIQDHFDKGGRGCAPGIKI